ncbi:TetR/AcrR family transcriptional regulator [Gracilibacillus sp. S3-1-1]|uniref:TetR/AcrR family transcriptional regulator n=1 Tax=Gracilibacillus pellucidus TaxID=3095368 RepID=A0ACC6M7Z0_9BACI|nr:TetR/AcrR family transcriptional regulator [Gracilibacillus sp. S3-1-1]MDX8047085.1 TetR/AcrR family transcriptional regulator [Gracilibacillus sp. S3-1-1]
MDEKKKQLIEVSLKLFSEKGFHSTSIQEIADKSHVSKGAFYLHFDSKDSLLIEAYQYYADTVLENLNNIEQSTNSASEQLAKQLAAFLRLFKEHKEYLVMQLRDNIHQSDKFEELIISLHKQSFEWMSHRLIDIYGEKLRPYIVDVVIQIEGLLGGYLKWIAIHDISVESNKIATYIVEKLDVLVTSILTEASPPLFQHDDLTRFNENHAQTLFQQIKQQAKNLERGEREQVAEALHVLEEEWQKKEPKKIIIQSMMEHLEAYPTIEQTVQALKRKL